MKKVNLRVVVYSGPLNFGLMKDLERCRRGQQCTCMTRCTYVCIFGHEHFATVACNCSVTLQLLNLCTQSLSLPFQIESAVILKCEGKRLLCAHLSRIPWSGAPRAPIRLNEPDDETVLYNHQWDEEQDCPLPFDTDVAQPRAEDCQLEDCITCVSTRNVWLRRFTLYIEDCGNGQFLMQRKQA